jgi:hypothetical protein
VQNRGYYLKGTPVLPATQPHKCFGRLSSNKKGERSMQVPVIAGVKHGHHADTNEAIRCAEVVKPTRAQEHKKEMVRYLVLVIALLAVVLLIAIALYYTQGNSVTIEHVSSLRPQATLLVS